MTSSINATIEGVIRPGGVARDLAALHKPTAANAVARCEQPGMPVTMGAPLPIRFIDEGDTLTLHAVYFDTRRHDSIDRCDR